MRVRGAVERLSSRIHAVLCSPSLVRWGAVAFALAGVAGLAAEGLSFAAMSRGFGEPSPTAWMVYTHVEWALTSVGMLGLCALVSDVRGRPFGLAVAGAALTLASFVVSLGLHLFGLRFFSPVWSHLSLLLSMGVLLAGISTLWVRGLRLWRFLPLVASSLGTPFADLLLLLAYSGGALRVEGLSGMQAALLMMSPATLASLLWVLFGCIMFGVREREAALLAKERREQEEKNLARARRLYAEAWDTGDLSVVDALVAEDFSDYSHNRHGPEEFKKTISDLRRTFPDLTLSIEEQIAEGDTVTTRCVLSGTDSGGVLWYPPTGKHAAFTGTYVDRFSDGGLVEHRGGIDTAALLKRLGLSSGG